MIPTFASRKLPIDLAIASGSCHKDTFATSKGIKFTLELFGRGDGERPAEDKAITAQDWLIEDRLGAQSEARFLRFVTSDLVQIVDLGTDDYSRCIELIVEYEDLGLGLVDASIIAIAERLAISQIATLNRLDFAVVRPRHLDAFDLLP